MAGHVTHTYFQTHFGVWKALLEYSSLSLSFPMANLKPPVTPPLT